MGRPVHDPEVQKLVEDQMKMNLAFISAGNISEFSGLAALEEAWLQQAMEYYIAQNGFEFPESNQEKK
jgi:hypothetical protein